MKRILAGILCTAVVFGNCNSAVISYAQETTPSSIEETSDAAYEEDDEADDAAASDDEVKESDESAESDESKEADDEKQTDASKNAGKDTSEIDSEDDSEDEDDVTSKQRSAAKTVNFSIIYGVTEYGLSQDLGCSFFEAKELIKSYYLQFPRVKEYLESLKRKGEELGYADTLFGRRRYLHELASQNKNLREFGFRAAMNTPIQGTAADIIKIAMNRVNSALSKSFSDALLVMQVHDELIVECAEKDADACAKLLKEEMEKAVKLNVPLVADCNVGRTWLEAK